MLEAATTAMYLSSRRIIYPNGTLGSLLSEELSGFVRSDPDPATAWQRALADFNAAIDAAQHDREAALRVLYMYTAYCRTPAAYERRRLDLIACGLPERFLPHWPDRINQPQLPA